jgi:hypothetical protein
MCYRWCRRGDLNPHVPKDTSTSSWRVCHSATSTWTSEDSGSVAGVEVRSAGWIVAVGRWSPGGLSPPGVVMGTSDPTVGPRGLAAERPRLDVVDVAALVRDITRLIGAEPVPDLDGTSSGAGEQPLAAADVDHSGRTVEHGPFHVGVGEQRHDLTRV